MSVDRTVGVVGTVIALIGSGLVVLFPNSARLGWGAIGLGVAIGAGAVFWALGGRHALKEQKIQPPHSGPIPAPQTQTLNAPTTNNNTFTPTNTFTPIINVNQSQSSSQTQSRNERVNPFPLPKLYPLKPTIQEMYVTRLGEITDAPTDLFGEQNMKAPVAIVDIRRANDDCPAPAIDVFPIVTIYDEHGTEKDRIAEAFWFKAQKHTKSFSVGTTHRLVIGMVVTGSLVPYRGKWRAVEASFITNMKYFELTSTPLKGKRFVAQIELVGTNHQYGVRINPIIEYHIETDPPDIMY